MLNIVELSLAVNDRWNTVKSLKKRINELILYADRYNNLIVNLKYNIEEETKNGNDNLVKMYKSELAGYRSAKKETDILLCDANRELSNAHTEYGAAVYALKNEVDIL